MRPGSWIGMSAIAIVCVVGLSACGAGAPSASPSANAPAITSPSGDALTITGVEYSYQGVPATAKVGTVVTFTNGGKELHELVIFRRNDGVITSLEELIAMPQEESDKLVTISPIVAIAAPGESAPEPITLEQPGSYIFICFIPVGTTSLPTGDPNGSADPNASPAVPGGPPHFTKGMVAELTVTE